MGYGGTEGEALTAARGGSRAPLTAQEIESVRALLRQGEPEARASATSALWSWHGRELGPGAAETALRAATVGYPWVAESPEEPGELLVRLLWHDPCCVSVADVEWAYSLCAAGGRRALLHLLALRADAEAVACLGGLIGIEGPRDLLPAPVPGLLTPLLDAPGAGVLGIPLASVAWRREWSEHVAEMVGKMALRGDLDAQDCAAVADIVEPLVDALVDTCDRATLMGGGGGPAGVGSGTDLSAQDRRRLGHLLPMVAHLPGGTASRILARALSSSDPRVAAMAASCLARRGEVVAEDRLALLWRDPQARLILLDGFSALGRHFSLPFEHVDHRVVAEAELVSWLAHPARLGTAPDEVEHRGVVACPPRWGHGLVHVLAFRVRPPHPAAGQDWMVGAVGPFEPGAVLGPHRASGFAARSLFVPEDDMDLNVHVKAIAEAIRRTGSDDPA